MVLDSSYVSSLQLVREDGQFFDVAFWLILKYVSPLVRLFFVRNTENKDDYTLKQKISNKIQTIYLKVKGQNLTSLL